MNTGCASCQALNRIPDDHVFHKGQVIDMLNGAVPKAPFDSWLNEATQA